MQEFEYHGHWWLPNKPEHKVSGNLKFSHQQGIILEILGTLEQEFPDIIHGETKDKHITLAQCIRFSEELRVGLVNSKYSKYNILIIFLGKHFYEKLDEIKFSRVNVNYTYLSNWGSLSSYDILEHVKKPNNICFNFTIAEDVSINLIAAQLIAKQYIDFNSDYLHPNQRLCSVWQLKFNESLNFNNIYQNYIFPLQNLKIN
jgi:hypothetical protein